MFDFPAYHATVASIGTNVPDQGRRPACAIVKTNHRSGCVRARRAPAPDRFNRHSVLQLVQEIKHTGFGIVPKLEAHGSLRFGIADRRRIPVCKARRTTEQPIAIVPDFNRHGVDAFRSALKVRVWDVFPFLVRFTGAKGRAGKNNENRQWAAKVCRKAKET